MDELGVASGVDLAQVFVTAGMDAAWLDEVAASVGPEPLEGALRWLAYTLETEALMDEIEDASTRISTLVAAVKQYSSVGQATSAAHDVHPGLDSTVVMLGHKLGGIEVRREYDRTIPPVQAYGAELNQVWTNLMDNAADAMEGRGVLTLRTRRDGDHVVVEVADDGPGIPEDVRGRIFEAFSPPRRPGQGSGWASTTPAHRGEAPLRRPRGRDRSERVRRSGPACRSPHERGPLPPRRRGIRGPHLS
jgi:signal transduction histidine kinase